MKVGLKVLPHQIQHLDQDLVSNGVEHLSAFFAGADDLPAPKDGQVLRNIGLLDTEPLLKSTGRHLTFTQNLDNGDSGGMPQSLENARLVFAEQVLHTVQDSRASECYQVMNIDNIPKIEYSG